MGDYIIEIVWDSNEREYYILDFSITRPIVGKEPTIEKADDFARGYKMGIEVDSYLKYQPTIIDSFITTENIKDYIRSKKESKK